MMQKILDLISSCCIKRWKMFGTFTSTDLLTCFSTQGSFGAPIHKYCKLSDLSLLDVHGQLILNVNVLEKRQRYQEIKQLSEIRKLKAPNGHLT